MPLSAPVTAAAAERSAGPMGRSAVVSMQGLRNNFEDAHFLSQELGMCGVFDGHLGDEAAAFCAERLHLHIGVHGETRRESLLRAFADCDEELKGALPADSEAGSTATFAVVQPNGTSSCRVLVANCGDSRTVLWRRADDTLEETRDHRPSDAAEKQRIEAAGGFVSEEFDPPRVDGQLACSRALGAFKFKRDEQLEPGAQKVSSVPEVYEWSAQRGDWLILACDGVWDVLDSRRVVDLVCKSEESDLATVLTCVLNLCIDKEADDNLTLMALELGSVAMAPCVVNVSPGNFLKVKDKEVLQEYVGFCLRFGFSLTKEMKPKSPPMASLAPVDRVPGSRFVGLPAPTAPVDSSPPGGARVATASMGEPLRMKVTGKRSVEFFIQAARRLIADKAVECASGLEVVAWGGAIAAACGVAAALQADGYAIARVETALVEGRSPELRVLVLPRGSSR